MLTSDEKAQLKKAQEAAFTANPSFATQKASLKQQFQTLKSEGAGVATKEQWQALHQQAEAFHQQLKTAELGIDPSLGPIFTKLEAAHAQWHHNSNNS